MNFTDDHEKQLRLLDEMFRFLDETAIQQIIDEHKVMAKLTDTIAPMPSVIMHLRDQLTFHDTEIMSLRQEVSSLRSDLRCLLEYLHNSQKAIDVHRDTLAQVATRHGLYY